MIDLEQMDIDDSIREALENNRTLTLRSYMIRDSGEEKLEKILQALLVHFDRRELSGPIHAAIRELVQNASKANLKRVVFNELGVNPYIEEEYERGMDTFRRYLIKRQLIRYRAKIVEKDYHFNVRFKFNNRVMFISVTNRFPLHPTEDRRIRERFTHAQALDNLYDFYMNYGDTTEGAGMGIAMVELLLSQAGIHRHNFTIFTDHKQNCTVARMIIPLAEDYVAPRMQFETERNRRAVTSDDLRYLIHTGEWSINWMGEI